MIRNFRQRIQVSILLPCILSSFIIALAIANHFFRVWHHSLPVQIIIIFFPAIIFSIAIYWALSQFNVLYTDRYTSKKIIISILVALLLAVGVYGLFMGSEFRVPTPPSMHTLEITSAATNKPKSQGTEVVLLQIDIGGESKSLSVFNGNGNWVEEAQYGYLTSLSTNQKASLTYKFVSDPYQEVRLLFYSHPSGGSVEVRLDDQVEVIDLYEADGGESLVIIQTQNPTWRMALVVVDVLSLCVIILFLEVLGWITLNYLKTYIHSEKKNNSLVMYLRGFISKIPLLLSTSLSKKNHGCIWYVVLFFFLLSAWLLDKYIGSHSVLWYLIALLMAVVVSYILMTKVGVRNRLKSLIPTSRYGKLALLFFLTASLLITYFGRNERSGWNKISAPTDAMSSLVSLIGWSSLSPDAMPLMSEDASSFEQVLMFSGVSTQMDWRFLRSFTGFIGTLFAPFVGVINGLLLANYISWAAAAWVAWRLTKKVFNDELAAFIAVILVAGGMGWVVHIGDYGAHLMSFTFYYLGILLIYESRVWCERRPLKIHLLLGLFIALASMQYGTGLNLLAGYILVSIWPGRNRWYTVVLVAVVVISARPLWNWNLNLINTFTNSITTWQNYNALEMGYWTEVPWSRVLEIMSQNRLIETIASALLNFLLFVDSPLVLGIGILSFFVLPGRPALRWFYIVFFSMPLVSAIWAYIEPVGGLGHLIFGNSLLLYSAFASAMSRLLHRAKAYKPFVVILLAIMVIVHFGWSTAHFWNYLGPVKTYFFDFDYSKSLLITPPIEALSLTGAEPTPILFGGNANLEQAGVYMEPSKGTVTPSFTKTLLSRGFYFLFLAPLVLLAIPEHNTGQGVIHKSRFPRLQAIFSSLGMRIFSPIFISFIAVWLLSAVLAMMVKERPAITDQWNAVVIPSGESIRYTITLSDQFLEALDRQANTNPEAELWFFEQMSGPGSCQIEVFIGDHSYLTASLPHIWRGGNRVTNTPEIIDALRNNRQVTLVVRALEDTVLAGWQRNGLNGRVLETSFPIEHKILPAFEIQLRRRSFNIQNRSSDEIRTLIFAGF